MNADAHLFRRACCHLHFLRRAEERGIEITGEEIERLERALDRTRPAYERPGVHRYRVTVKHALGRLGVAYDTHLGCLVSVWWRWPVPERAKKPVAARDVEAGEAWLFDHRTVAEVEGNESIARNGVAHGLGK